MDKNYKFGNPANSPARSQNLNDSTSSFVAMDKEMTNKSSKKIKLDTRNFALLQGMGNGNSTIMTKICFTGGPCAGKIWTD